MSIWKQSRWDALHLCIALSQAGATTALALAWEHSGWSSRAAGFVLLVAMITYNIVIVSHLFTHSKWFNSNALNALASVLNSVNAGQSVQAYQLSHVRNHHRYNNDRADERGTTKDTSSTFSGGKDGEHVGLFRYAFGGAIGTLRGLLTALVSVLMCWKTVQPEPSLAVYASRFEPRRSQEFRQIVWDRFGVVLSLAVFCVISWQWTVSSYLPALYLSFALVNVHNYYEHFGADPSSRYADAVSYYGWLYNRLTFNDGYHQEHHLRPQSHWSMLPEVRSKHRAGLDGIARVVSPVPALLGFLHRSRPMLHRNGQPASPIETTDAAAEASEVL